MQHEAGSSILDGEVLRRADELHAEFRSAKPFPHVVIDDFLDAELCRGLVREFPAYDADTFRNEYGELGKAWHSAISHLGPAYSRLDQGLRSEAFLAFLSRISGVYDLLFDPSYFGGGTHENLQGMELDPHVDFNLHPSTSLHRRLNMLLYLNPVWDDAWGGALELHTNPWLHPALNEVKTVSPLFNRCVLFETSDRSFHGFRRIDLPPDERETSRRSIAVYFYTKQRPPCPLIPHDITIYTDRPLPEHIREGHTLSGQDVATLEGLLARRDRKLEYLYGRAVDYAQPTLERQVEDTHGLHAAHVPLGATRSAALAALVRRGARRAARELRAVLSMPSASDRPPGRTS